VEGRGSAPGHNLPANLWRTFGFVLTLEQFILTDDL
jgi:hypothetical protein